MSIMYSLADLHDNSCVRKQPFGGQEPELVLRGREPLHDESLGPRSVGWGEKKLTQVVLFTTTSQATTSGAIDRMCQWKQLKC